MDNTTLAVWFFISGSYMMVLASGFGIGFFIRWFRSEKMVRKELFEGIAKGNPTDLIILDGFRKLHKDKKG